ncbi:MAG: tripartite tricarboxylate transporter TctB family protein [Salinarimonadaceae bacterium]|nr:MAG: tripartite tricarboxylate transporter TctB family protein [Salinarimonadaceae bacterium]
MSSEQPAPLRLLTRAIAAIAARPRVLASFAITFSFGAMVLTEALNYRLGTLHRMGPGYFPTILGIGLIILSFTLLFERNGEDGERLPAKFLPVLVVPVAMGIFAFMIERYGVYPATTVLVIVAGLADQTFRPVFLLLMALLVPAAVTVIFVFLLGLPIKPFVW